MVRTWLWRYTMIAFMLSVLLLVSVVHLAQAKTSNEKQFQAPKNVPVIAPQGMESNQARQNEPATLVAIRVASHREATPKYDRVVFEFGGRLPASVQHEYVSKLYSGGSGLEIPIKGNSILEFHFSTAFVSRAAGGPTVPERISYTLPIVQEVVCSEDSEGYVSYGIGISRQTPVRFFTLANPTRVVVDFIHM